MSAPTVHQKLRDATAVSHQRLDQLFSGFDLGSIEGYGPFLQAHAAAALSVEAALDQAGMAQHLEDWPQRRRGAALRADLSTLDLDLPPMLAAPALNRAGAAWGAAYVLEGSRLGGLLLAKRLPPAAPMAYLRGSLPTTAWPLFLKSLDAALTTEAEVDAAVTAAIDTFAVFEAAGRQELEALRA